MSPLDAFTKRMFDIVCAFLGLSLLGWLILLAWLAASIDTRNNGFFTQVRVGQNGRLFKVVKIRTMLIKAGLNTSVTTATDERITTLGSMFRKTKIDELPQLFNVLVGQMSFVGPRPDVPGFADKLKGEARLLLTVKPGITGPASLKYKYEEQLLASVEAPETYNRNVLWPDKVKINIEYIKAWTLTKDIQYMIKTLVS